MVYKNETYQPSIDAGLGLIYRLNDLWAKADRRALTGDNDYWELVLDRIFSNLMYREDMEVIKDSEGKIIDVNVDEDSFEKWKIIKQKIRESKKKIFSGQKKDIIKNKLEHYNALIVYDLWLRKFMQSLGGLYLKESESNPSHALFGGAFSKRR